MQPKVTAVLVARNGASYLPRTLAALAAQTRRPDAVVMVDAGSSDTSAALLAAATPGRLVTAAGRRPFGAAVKHSIGQLPPQEHVDEWLWLLGHDNAPEPRALAALLGAVEVAPSVAIAGPKLMRWDEPGVIASFGETVTMLGRSISMVSGELDQAQHDVQSDLLGVAAGGMLVRRKVWTSLGGFDPALPTVDAALDFAIRARLAGHRVVGVPSARVTSAGPPELFGRRTLSAGTQNRIQRSAQLHRRLAYAPAAAVPLHWLSLMPLAVLRSLFHVVAKRPGAVGGELAAGVRAMFDGTVPAARSTIRRNRLMGWAAIGALRMPWHEVRERRATERAASLSAPIVRDRIGFFTGGGAWVVLVAAVAGILTFGGLVGAPALTGGGLLPLSATAGDLWQHIGYAWRDVGSGFLGAADPFSYLLAVLGSLTFWSPSFSIVLLYLLALPFAALSAWWCAARFSTRGWAPGIAALAWAVAPPFLSSLGEGHLGAVIAHILLPSLVLAVVGAARSWSLAAVAGLLFAAVAASAPVLVPALVIALVAWAAAHPRGLVRLLGILIPAAALFAPLIVQQLSRGNVLALFADPGRPVVDPAPGGLQLAFGATGGGALGWDSFLTALGGSAGAAPLVVALLLAPFAVLVALALFRPGSGRSIPALVVALLGFLTAVFATHLQVSIVGATTTPVWSGSGLSLYWLGLVGAMTVTLDGLRRAATVPALVAALGLVIVAIPAFAAVGTGAVAVSESNGRMLPAFATAEAVSRPELGTLELSAQPRGGVAATVHRGLGTTLDEQSTLDSTATVLSPADEDLAVLAGNIASRSGFDVASELDRLQIAFVLLPASTDPASDAARQRVSEALDGNRLLTPIGNTANGYLWHYADLADGAAPTGPGPLETPTGTVIIVGQAIVFGLTILLAIPTTRRRRLRAARVTGAAQDQPASARAEEEAS